MSLDDPNKRYGEAEASEVFESTEPAKTVAVRSARKKVSVTVKGAIAAFQPALLGAQKIKGVSFENLGDDITVISANTTRKKLIKALVSQRGVSVVEDDDYEDVFEEATEQVA